MSDWKNVQYKDGKFKTGEGGGGGGSSTLAGLDDVNVSNPSNGQVLKYDSSTQKWKNENESGGGSVNDVTLDGNSVVNGQGTAVLTTPNVSNLKDTNISSPSSGQTLQYNATNQKWENVTPASGGNVDDVKVNGSSVVDANKVAQITSYKEVTQAEYNALPASKTNDDILYCIKDSAGADGFPPLIYSDEEREIGVWRDGKPLYKKTINATISNTTQWIDTGVDSTGEIIYTEGFLLNSGGITILGNSDPSALVGIGTIIDGVVTSGKWSLLYRTTSSILNNGTVYITLLYTKGSDTAGSGTWTTQGGYAHHYSTTEHVVGTWIDGKPLYEKVVQTTFSTTTHEGNQVYSGYIDVSSEIPNIDMAWLDTGMSSYKPTVSQTRDFFTGWYEQDESKLFVLTLYSRSNVPCTLVIRYTKTTD